jgi:hemerythrin
MPEWNSSMEIGIPVLDRQHQELVNQLNELGRAMKRGRGRETISQLLAFLSHYVEDHFRVEEGLMRHHKYPGLEEQRFLHEKFKRELAAHVDDYAGNPTDHSLTVEIHGWGMNWLMDHIMNVDARFGEYARERGITVGAADSGGTV